MSTANLLVELFVEELPPKALKKLGDSFAQLIADALRAKVWPLLDAGRVAPVLHAEFPLAQAAEAHRLMESSTHVGKIVLRVGA